MAQIGLADTLKLLAAGYKKKDIEALASIDETPIEQGQDRPCFSLDLSLTAGRCPDPPSPVGRKGTRCPFPSDRVIRVISSRAARMLTHPACCPLTPFPLLSENISRSAVC